MKTGPEGNAFFIGAAMYSYGHLASLVAGIQGPLNRNAEELDHVGIYISDDIQTYASILALWMSGKAFIPINPHFPTSRNLKIIEQLDLDLLLHSIPIPEELKRPGCKLLGTSEIDFQSGSIPLIERFSPLKDAYVLFTSGSTGIPKGVRISFHNLNAFVRDFIAYPSYSFSRDDRFLQIYDLSFDGSLPCYVVPMAVGASVYTVSQSEIKYLAAYKLMQDHQLTVVKMPPSTLSYLTPYFPSISLPSVKYCMLGGETFPALTVKEFETCIPNALIQNVYGPTEATIINLIYDWNGPGTNRKELHGIASIGKGFGSNRVRVWKESDPEGNPGLGEPGELLVAGDQVSPGYWNNPEQDERAFMELEEDGIPVRFYRTGDIVSMDEEGDVMFIGRNDEQVQVRGYRVELGEIESLARSFLDGTNVLAAGIETGTGEMKIMLAVESDKFDTTRLDDHLADNLPSYMIPEQIIVIAHFPRLVSGKLDRKAINDLLTT